jgi:dipeptidyl aminopeptidase/acylaminoacyl peptidase
MNGEASCQEFERKKWKTEVHLRRKEIRIKEAEQSRLPREAERSRWWNPLFIAIVGATIAALGSIGVSWWNGRIAEETENIKAESAHIVEVLHTKDEKKARENLTFLIESGLITGATAEKVENYLTRTPVERSPLVTSVPAVQPVNTGPEVVISASFSPDGERVVTASADHIARVWDLSGPTPVSTVLADHTGLVNSVSFSPDGKRVVTASHDNTARVWDLSGPTPVSTVLAGHTDLINSASFSPDGKRVVTASDDYTARVWNLNGPTPVSTVLALDLDAVNSASFSPDGEWVVTASADNTALVWDLSGRAPVSTLLAGHTDLINSALFSPDGKRVVTASDDGTARVWDLSRRTPVSGGNVEWTAPSRVLAGHTDAVNSASFSADGKRVVTASDDGTARV